MKRLVSLTIVVTIAFWALAVNATAQVPNQMQYQGYLTDDGGSPLDTTVDMEFVIYDDSVGSGIIWSETHLDVTVDDGVFEAILGSVIGVTEDVLSDSVRWLGITVGDDSEIYPRTKLVTVPYAFRVSTVDGAAGGIISGDVAIQSDLDLDGDLRVTGKVGIGTPSPTSRLDVNLGFGSVKCGGPSPGDILMAHFNGGGEGAAVNASYGSNYVLLAGDNPSHAYAGEFHGDVYAYGDFEVSGVITSSGTVDFSSENLITTGNVGIGTVTPSDMLHVNGGNIRISGAGKGLYFPDGSFQTTAGVGPATALNNDLDAVITGDADANGTGGVKLRTGSNDRLTILNNGRVGIGTTSPTAELDVSLGFGTVKCGGESEGDILMAHFDGGGEGAAVNASYGSNYVLLAGDNPSHAYAGEFHGDVYAYGDFEVSGTITSSGTVDFSSENLITTGNVGIGTPSPTSRLDVNLGFGSVKCGGPSPGDILMAHFNGGGEGAAVNASYGSNYVLLAGDNPSHAYAGEFHGDVYAYGDFEVSGVITSSGTVDFSDEDLITTGNVGIGTPSPTTELDVNLEYGTVRCGGPSPGDILVAHFNGGGEGAAISASLGAAASPAAYLAFSRPTGALAGYFDGDVETTGRTTTSVLEITGGMDLAEPFTISEPDNLAPGTVVIIDPDNPGQLKMSTEAYDTRVAGIVSGAGGINPGVTLRQQSLSLGDQSVALAGRVYCLVDASYGPIQPGDLLTTSNTSGHAMKVKDMSKAQGAIIGKAMTSLPEGKGLVLVLVTHQ